jgi:hypothetical protein
MTADDAAKRGFSDFIARHEKRVVLVLCALAMVRVFVFSAAFPFFNNVDEQAHYDTVYKYAHGYLPREAWPKFDVEAAEAIALYATLEYLNPPEPPRSGPARRPAWSYPEAAIERWLPGAVKVRAARTNHEANSPPTYYLLAGGWYNLGKALGFEAGSLLYWIRFLNVPIYGLLIWISYGLCRSVRQDDPTLRIGVPLILAFLPQDVFFSINSDVLSPLLFAAFLYLLVRSMSAPLGLLLHLLAGALVAAAFLAKYSNFAIVIAFAFFLLRAALDLRKSDGTSRRWLGVALALLAAGVPVVAWFAWNTWALGDPTGSTAKFQLFGITVKPLARLFDHPIFTPAGLAGYLADLIRTSWRGEFVWHLEMMASPSADFVYVSTSCLFLLASIHGLVKGREVADPVWPRIGWLSVGILVLDVAFLSALSIAFDFGTSWYPSDEYPFFASGRLIGGGLIPFLMLYVDGLTRLLSRLPGRIQPLSVLALLSLVMLVSEISLTWKVFPSAWNWFHLP